MKRQRLKKKYVEMHEALEIGEFASLHKFLANFNVSSKNEYKDIPRARGCAAVQRTLTEKFVNSFNPWIGKVLDSNMDLQVILGHYACATYVVNYVNKADKGMSNLHKAVLQILGENPNIDYATVHRMLGVTMLKGVQVCATNGLVPHAAENVPEEPACGVHSNLLPGGMRAGAQDQEGAGQAQRILH